MKFYLIFICIDFIQIFVLQLQLHSWINPSLHSAYLFWVGNAQKITILTPCIIVIECEQTILECVLRTLSISSFYVYLLRSFILMCLSPIAIYTFLSLQQISVIPYLLLGLVTHRCARSMLSFCWQGWIDQHILILLQISPFLNA